MKKNQSSANRARIYRNLSLISLTWFSLSVFFTNCGVGFKSDSASSSSSDNTTAEKTIYCGPEDRYFPLNAVNVPVSQKANLQALLDANKIIRLEPVNYNVALTVRAGQQVYGYPGKTILTTVTIEPGSRETVVRGLNLNWLSFPTSNASTRDNCFSMIEGSVKAVNSVVESNLFLSFFHADLDLDTSGGGFIKNNKFIRIQSHNGAFDTHKPSINLVGDQAQNSTGNTFVFVNHLGPYSTPILLKNQNEVSLVAVDVEDYDTTPGTEAVITAKNVKKLRVMDLQGGIDQGMLDVGAEEFMLVGSAFYRTGPSPFILRSNNQRALWLSGMSNMTNILTDENPSGTRISAETSDLKRFQVNKTSAATLTGASATDTMNMLANAPNTVAWSRPADRPIADPGGPNWNANLASKPDDAPAIQALLNANPDRTIQLEARPYYIGTSIRITGSAAIIGAGVDKTVLIAKDDSINIFQMESVRFTFMDFTLQGGSVGLSFTLPGLQASGFYMSHLVFRDMKTAGIYLNKTYAWDNAYLEYVDFYKNKVGIKVFGENLTSGESPTNAYIDKIFFYRNQYVSNEKGVEFDPKRQSNMNVWFESSFRDNTVATLDCNPWNTTYFFISSVFKNNAGNPSINAGTTSYFVNSKIVAGPALSVFPQNTVCEGCDISRGSGSTATVFKVNADSDPREFLMSWLLNSNMNDVPLGAINVAPSRWSMLFINNLMAPVDSQYSIPMSMFIYETQITPYLGDDVRYPPVFWLTGAVSPGTRFLRSPAAQ